MTFRAIASRGGLIGLLALGATLAAESAALWLIVAGPIGPRTAIAGLFALLLAPVVARLAFWVWGYYRLAYEISRDGLVIRWAGVRQVIPMGDITRIASSRELIGGLEGIQWPGYYVGHSRVRPDAGAAPVDVLVYATAPPPDQLVIFTSAPLAYAITPGDQSAFIEEFKVRRRLGPVQSLRHETVRPAPLQRAIWSDIFTLRLLVLAAVLNALLFGLIAWRYPGLPAKLALQFRFDALAHPVPAALRPRNVIWTLPAVGLGAIGLNAVLAVIVHPRARLGAALLVVGVVLLQVIIGVALIRIL